MKVANHNGNYSFSPQGSLVLSETIKLCLSAMYVVCEKGSFAAATRAFMQETHIRLVLHMAGLAILYCANNAITFWVFSRADPGSIAVVKSASTAVSALLMQNIGRSASTRPLSLARWAVIATQTMALVVAQLDACAGRAHLEAAVYVVLLASMLNSSVANVWNAAVVNAFRGVSLGTKNVYLYLFGAALNFVAFACARWRDPTAPALLHGYGPAAVCVVACNALMGIAINAVYKFGDALVRALAGAAATVALVCASVAFFGARIDAVAFLGVAIVLAAIYLFFALDALEKRLDDVNVDCR